MLSQEEFQNPESNSNPGYDPNSENLRFPAEVNEQPVYSTANNSVPSAPATPFNYISGIVGAILGAAVGAIPWIILLNMGWMVGWLAFLIGFTSLFGYKLFKGPKNTVFAAITIWLTSLAIIIFANFLMIIIEMYKADLIISFESVRFMFDYFIHDSGFIRDVVISFVFGGIGLFGINRQISSYTGK